MMIAETIHSTCKSATLITSCNHFGLSISYDELRRYHSDLAHLIVESADGEVPLPSQFDRDDFTIGAADNFDHSENTLSGIGESHDAVCVLFQDKPKVAHRKPPISETNVIHGAKVFTEELECQKLKEFTPKSKKITLPEGYTVDDELFQGNQSVFKEAEVKDHAWLLSKLDPDGKDLEGIQTTPSWSAFNTTITSECLQEKIVGFLPVFPYPITDPQTVYSVLKNFQNICSQLTQSALPVACDEGVYKIARDIILANPEQFSDIILLLGNFHMIKTLLRAIGKYLKGSGAETILSENAVFGPNVVLQVIAGTDYERSLTGFTMIAEVMLRLQWKEFLNVKGTEGYSDAFTVISQLKDSVASRDRHGSQELVKEFTERSAGLLGDFDQFKEESNAVSETFAYWDHFIEMVKLAWRFVRADREGCGSYIYSVCRKPYPSSYSVAQQIMSGGVHYIWRICADSQKHILTFMTCSWLENSW
jgi:hypothetical protein